MRSFKNVVKNRIFCIGIATVHINTQMKQVYCFTFGIYTGEK